MLPFHAPIERHFTSWELILVEMIAVLIFILSVLVVLTIFFKFLHRHKQKRDRALQQEWQRLLLSYLGNREGRPILSIDVNIYLKSPSW